MFCSQLMSFSVHHEPNDPNAAPGQEDEPVPTVPENYDVPARPGWTAHAKTAYGEDVIRYNYPKDEAGLQNTGLLTAQGFMWEYQALHQVNDVCGADAEEAKSAITQVFGSDGRGRTGKHSEYDGKYYASGKPNTRGDMLLKDDFETEPAGGSDGKQYLRSVHVDDHFWPAV